MAEPQWAEESFHRKEMRKWDAPKREGGHNRDGHQEFPKMMYRAQVNPLSGKTEAMITRDVESEDRTRVILSAEQFNASCQFTVNSEEEYQRAKADGWRDSPTEAKAQAEAELDNLARAAAERAHADRRMSDKAQKEAEAAEAETDQHLGEIPAKRGPGRPRKDASSAA